MSGCIVQRQGHRHVLALATTAKLKMTLNHHVGFRMVEWVGFTFTTIIGIEKNLVVIAARNG